ncbi:MAG: hypothetical protein WC503_04265 [Candidatus Shapirobacteria bacterium]
MLSVGIFINGKIIAQVDAVNVSEGLGKEYGKGNQFYQLNTNDDKIIEHIYEDGAIVLAIKMLKELLLEQS